MYSLNVEIAGVNFLVNCRDSIILKNSEPAYKPFLKTDIDPELVDIYIDLELNNIPDTKNLKKIFDSGQSWAMYQNSDDYIVTLNPPASNKKPVRAARFDRHIKNVTVYSGETSANKNNYIAVSNPVGYPLDQILLMYFLAQREGALIHAAGIDINGRGYIFPGRSGAGKSTLTKQFTSKKNMDLLSDDRVVIRKIDKSFKVFGTPWAGEAGIAENKNLPLYGIFFIQQGTENKIREIKPAEAFERLMSVISIPWYDREVMTKIFAFCDDLISNINAYELKFKPDSEIVDVFRKFISKQKSGI